MNKEFNTTELNDEIASKFDVTKKQAAEISSFIFAKLAEELAAPEYGHRLEFKHLGVFKLAKVAERSGRSSLNGKEWTKPEHYAVKFKAGKQFIAKLNSFNKLDAPVM